MLRQLFHRAVWIVCLTCVVSLLAGCAGWAPGNGQPTTSLRQRWSKPDTFGLDARAREIERNLGVE